MDLGLGSEFMGGSRRLHGQRPQEAKRHVYMCREQVPHNELTFAVLHDLTVA